MPIVTGEGIEVYENDIDLYLKMYEEEKKVSCYEISQNRWNSVLLYIQKRVFNNRDELMSEVNKSMYDEYVVNYICDIYINLCFEYDKEISLNGFSHLTGIDRDTLKSWGKEETRSNIYYDSNGNRIGNIQIWKINHPGEEYRQELGSSCSAIYKKLVYENEESLSGKLISGGLNPMKILPSLNRRHKWNMPGNSNVGGEEQPTIEQIQQRRAQRLPEVDVKSLPSADF